MKKPNILLITSDQQHHSTLGRVNPKIRTPSLDRLAAQGTSFTRAYCPNPTCTPSRASIITGMYPSQHGAWTLGTKLPEDTPTLGGILRGRGYGASLIGKAHFQPLQTTDEFPSIESFEYLKDLDFWKRFDEVFYGFDHVELARNHTNEFLVGQHYAAWMEEKGLSNWRDYFAEPVGRMKETVTGRWEIPEAYHYDAWIAERTNAALGRYAASDQPFFLWASFLDPHYPQMVPAPWDTMYDPEDIEIPPFDIAEHDRNPPYFRQVFEENPDFTAYRESGFGIHGLHRHVYDVADLKRQTAVYYGMVSLMDKYVGRILDRLEALGLADDTIVVYTTDHGDLFGQHGFRHKCVFHYEDLLRIPFIVRYPGRVPANADSAALQSLVDLAPTFLSYLGADIPRAMTGVDQRLVWNGEQGAARRHVIVENRHEPTTMNLRTYVDDRYKLTVHCGRAYGEMYDLQEDPGETRNLWGDAAYKDLKIELLLKYAEAELLKEPMWMPRIWGA